MPAKQYAKIPCAIANMPLTIEAIGLYTWLSLHADQNGQVATSRAALAKATGMSAQQIRTALQKLEATKLITKLATKHPTKFATTITMCYPSSYEPKKNSSNQVANQVTNQVSNQVSRANKNDNINISSLTKEEKKEKPTTIVVGEKKEKKVAAIAATNKNDLESRREKFYESLIPYVQRYGGETVREFYNYWTEANRSLTKMRYEQQPTWETAKRLATWAKNEHKYANHHTSNPASHPTDAQLVTDAAALIEQMATERRARQAAVRQ